MKTPLETATTELTRRVPPHSVEAERAVLAGTILRSSVMGQIAPLLRPEDFYLPAHRLLYAGALELHAANSPVELVTLAQRLRDRGELESAGGAAYLAELAQAAVSAANAEYYAKIVRDKAIQRGLIEAGAHIISTSFDTARDVAGLIDEAEQSVLAISSRNSGGFRSVQELVGGVVDAVLKPAAGGITGLPTGYPELDAITHGLQPSDLIIVAARPAMGKTALALNLAMRVAIAEGAPVGIFSLEMSEHQLMQRMISLWGKIPQEQLATGRLTKNAGARFFETADLLRTAPLFINETPAISTLELRSQARRLKAEHGLGLVVVDYLQLMRSSRRTDSRELEISDISRSLKALAKELNIPVIALSQLNRKVEERQDKRPMLSDLRESGAIEQDADIVIFLHREEAYKPDTAKKGIAELIIGKHRNGRTGTVELAFLPEYTAFEPLART
ncbi:replicative DNA helicase [uncultured Bilophila sp.]|uniref:replicative DNA helicase n=1 Tax=uncultured Bilophila sp. TaxID=529385 RepID=UPI00262D3624|nr:replicative DNA helicase [uncultured Bilophila sp.]